MSRNVRIVPDPEDKGWTQDGTTANGTPIYQWTGTQEPDEGAGIEDGNTEGQITTWDGSAWTPEGAVVVDSSGFLFANSFSTNPNNYAHITFLGDTVNQQGVYIGLDANGGVDINNRDGGEFKYLSNGSVPFKIDAAGDAQFDGAIVSNGGNLIPSFAHPHIYRDGGNLNITGRTDGGAGQNVYVRTGASGDIRLTIDSTGNAAFSGRASFSGAQSTSQVNVKGALRFEGPSGENTWLERTSDAFKINAHAGAGFEVATGSGPALTIDALGDAAFSGSISLAQSIYRNASGAGGLKFTTFNTVIPTDNTGTNTDGELSLGSAASQRFKDGFFSGSVTSTRMIADGHLVMSTRDLIETLSTLRNATKDENTLEGLRDSIGNAIGGLIEKFESMQDQVSTQDIQE